MPGSWNSEKSDPGAKLNETAVDRTTELMRVLAESFGYSKRKIAPHVWSNAEREVGKAMTDFLIFDASNGESTEEVTERVESIDALVDQSMERLRSALGPLVPMPGVALEAIAESQRALAEDVMQMSERTAEQEVHRG